MFYAKIDFAMEISRFRKLTNAPSNAKISFEILLHQTPFHSIGGYKPLITALEKICASGVTCPYYKLRVNKVPRMLLILRASFVSPALLPRKDSKTGYHTN